MGDEKRSKSIGFKEKYPKITLFEDFYQLETLGVVETESEWGDKRRPFPLNFIQLKEQFKENTALFSDFLADLCQLLEQKQVKYVRLAGFQTLTAEKQQKFIDFLDENPYLLDCVPLGHVQGYQATSSSSSSSSDSTKTSQEVVCQEKTLLPFLWRNVFLNHCPESEKNPEFKDNFWQQAAHLVVHGQATNLMESNARPNCTAREFHFFPPDVMANNFIDNCIFGMSDVLFGHMAVYLKNKSIANQFTYVIPSPMSGRGKKPLKLNQLKQLIDHVDQWKFAKIHLDVVDEFEELVGIIPLLLAKMPTLCQRLHIQLVLDQRNPKSLYHNPKSSHNSREKSLDEEGRLLMTFFQTLERLYMSNPALVTQFELELVGRYPFSHNFEQSCLKYKEEFANLALANQRGMTVDHPELIRPVLDLTAVKPAANLWAGPTADNTLRSSKKRKGNRRITLQHTHQQQVVQQIQQQKQYRVVQTVAHKTTKADRLIDKALFLKPYQYSGDYEKMGFLWDSVCGKTPSSTYIKWITPSAAQQLVQYDYIYQGGLVPGTVGFSIEKQEGEFVLNFTKDAKPYPNPLFALTPIPYLPYEMLENYGNWVFRDYPDRPDYIDRFDSRYHLSDHGSDRELFNNRFKKMLELEGKGSIVDTYKLIFWPSLIESDLDQVNVGWIRLYARFGADAVEKLAKTLDQLKQHNQEAFAKFYQFFLGNSHDFSEFSDPKSLEIIESIAKFSPNQILWWNTLVTEHQRFLPKNESVLGAEFSAINLVDLYEGFSCFLTQYQTLARQNGLADQDLPPVCRFKNVRNLKTSLYRLLSILKNARNFSEQVQHLEDLDLGPEGAYYASKENAFSFADAKMGLSAFNRATLYYAKKDVFLGKAGSGFKYIPGTPIDELNSLYGKHIPILLLSSTDRRGNKINYAHSGYAFFIFDGSKLISLEHNGYEDSLPLESCMAPSSIRRVAPLPAFLERSLLMMPELARLNFPLSSKGETTLEYTVDDDLLIAKANDQFCVFASDDNRLNFLHLFYRSLGTLKSTRPFSEITKLVAIVTEAFKNQFPSYQNEENQKKLLCLFARSLRTRQDQQYLPLQAIKAFCDAAKNTTPVEIVKLLDKALSYKNAAFTLSSLLIFMQALALPQAASLSELITGMGDAFWKNLDARTKNQNPIDLSVYLDICLQYKNAKHLLPLLGIVDRENFSVDNFNAFAKNFLSLPIKIQEDIAYLWTRIEAKNYRHIFSRLEGEMSAAEDLILGPSSFSNTSSASYASVHASTAPVSKNQSTSKTSIVSEESRPGKFPALTGWSSWLSSLPKNDASYAALEKSLLNRFRNLQIDLKGNVDKGISMLAFLKEHFSAEEQEKYKTEIEFPKRLLATIFKYIKDDQKRVATIFSVERLLNIFASDAIKKTGIESYLESKLIFLLTKKLASVLPNAIDSLGALNKLFKYTEKYSEFLNVCNKIHPKVLASVLSLLEKTKTTFYIENLQTILEVIVKNSKYTNAFPVDLFGKLLASELAIFSFPIEESERSKKAIAYVKDVFLLDAADAIKELLLVNFLQNVEKVTDQNLFFDQLSQVLAFNQKPAVMKGILELWQFFNGSHDESNTTQITQLFGLLLPLVNKCPKNARENFLNYLRSLNLEIIYLLLKKIVNIQNDTLQENILIILASFNHPEQEKHSTDAALRLVEILTAYPESARRLAEVCVNIPSPSVVEISRFIETIPARMFGAVFESSFITFLHVFRISPHGPRDIADQFSTDRVLSTINNMVDLHDHRPLSDVTRQKLRDCFTYVNAIGYSHPVFNNKSVKDLYPSEVKMLWKSLAEMIQDENSSPEEKLIAFLTAIAVEREVIYRTSHVEHIIFPDSTQIIDLIYGVLNPGNIGFQIPTGEGKGVIEAMQAALFALTGKPIFVSTPRLAIAERNRAEFSPCFNYLGIPQGEQVITENSSMEDVVPGGIHYTTPTHFGLFMDKQKLSAKKSLLDDFFMIVSEFDYSATNVTHMRHSRLMDASFEDNKSSAIGWIYSLANDFLIQGKTYDDEIQALKTYIEANITEEQKEALGKLKPSDERLTRWLNAAKVVLTLKEDVDYIVVTRIEDSVEGKKEFYTIQILEGGEPSENAEYSRAIQQLLCDKRNKELDQIDPGKQRPRYRVTPEGVVTTLLTHKNLMQMAGNKNQLFVTSATLGSKPELKRFAAECNLKTMVKVPHHQGDQRQRDTILSRDAIERKQRVLADIHAYLNTVSQSPMPILIRPKDIEEAEDWYNVIKAQFSHHSKIHTFQLYTGKGYDVSPLSQQKSKPIDQLATKQAGVAGTITISTLMGRETDIRPRLGKKSKSTLHPEGLWAIQTYLSSYRDQEQAAGRPGRRGTQGRASLYVTEEELARVETLNGEKNSLVISSQPLDKKIQHAQTIIAKKEAWKLQQHNVFGDYLRDLYEYFLVLYHQLEVNDPNQTVHNQFHMQWIMLLERLEDEWFDILEEQGVTDKSEDKEKLTACLSIYLDSLKMGGRDLKSGFGKLQLKDKVDGLAESIPNPPSFELKKNEELGSSRIPNPIVPLVLSLPNEAETTQIYFQFALRGKIISGKSAANEAWEKGAREKINRIRQTLSFQEEYGEVKKNLLELNEEFISRYAPYFTSTMVSSEFKTFVSLHHDLMQLVDRSNDRKLQKNISAAINEQYVKDLQSSCPAGTTTSFFAYYTQLTTWQSMFPWFENVSVKGDQELVRNVVSSVKKEIKTYGRAWFRSEDRIHAYKGLKSKLKAYEAKLEEKTESLESHLPELLEILTKAREEALNSDITINADRRAHCISLRQRHIENSRYQKMLDSVITKVMLVSEKFGLTDALEKTQKDQIDSLVSNFPLASRPTNFFSNPDKAIKKLHKHTVEKDQQSVVNILTQKSVLFSHVNVASSDKKEEADLPIKDNDKDNDKKSQL